MYYQLPAPLALGMLGAIAGLFGGGFTQSFPVWVGAATGASVGCAMCICMMLSPVPVPVPRPEPRPVVVQNIYVTYVTGAPKDTLPKAKVIEN